MTKRRRPWNKGRKLPAEPRRRTKSRAPEGVLHPASALLGGSFAVEWAIVAMTIASSSEQRWGASRFWENGEMAQKVEQREHSDWAQSAQKQTIVYFNNCNNRDHVALFGSGAFFDLGISGRQGGQARNLPQGQPCVVVERASEQEMEFSWYSFKYEARLPDEKKGPDRVFFGTFLASEMLPKAKAARSKRYSALFKTNGALKNGSVFHKAIAVGLLPPPRPQPLRTAGPGAPPSRPRAWPIRDTPAVGDGDTDRATVRADAI